MSDASQSDWTSAQILLVNKPVGLSSNQCLQRVKRLIQVKKAGHTGSLDPLASGLLPICLNRATKCAQYFLGAKKVYRVRAQLGIQTATGDLEGEVIQRQPVPEFTDATLCDVLAGFLGERLQIPPMYSAVKVQGQRLYRLARQGQEVAREPRVIHIEALDFIARTEEGFEFSVRCSKGTYVRVLVEELAQALGTCGTVALLERTQLADLKLEQAISLDQLTQWREGELAEERLNQALLSPRMALAHLPAIEMTAAQAILIRNGASTRFLPTPTAGQYRLEVAGELFGIGEFAEKKWKIVQIGVV